MTDELCDVVGTCGPLVPLMLSVDLWVRPGKPNELGRRIKKAATLLLRPPLYRSNAYRAV